MINKLWKSLFLTLCIPIILTGCGEGGGPFEMATATTMVVGDSGAGNVQFLVNPEESMGQGTVTAQIDQEFNNRRTLVIEAFNMTVDFPSIGSLTLHLNPNLPSTATIYRLDGNNQPFGTHTMTLNLIVETPDQNLNYDNVMLASDTATLELVQPLPTLSFLFMGDSKELQTLGLSVVIPAELVTSNEDPLLVQ